MGVVSHDANLLVSESGGFEVPNSALGLGFVFEDAHGDAVGFILVSAQRTDVVDRVAGLLVGADDYLGKPFETDELLARARRFLRTAQPRAPRGGRLGRLTPRETEVLELLLDGLTVKEIASRLVISPKTAATHLQRILGKLDVHSRAQAVAVVLGEGAGARLPEPSAGGG